MKKPPYDKVALLQSIEQFEDNIEKLLTILTKENQAQISPFIQMETNRIAEFKRLVLLHEKYEEEQLLKEG